MKNKQSKSIYISGMTCTSCEVLITDVLKEEGVKDIKISHSRGRADVEYEAGQISWDRIFKKIKTLGYGTSFEPIKEEKVRVTGEQWFYAVLIVFGLYLVYKYLQWIGLLDWLKVDTNNINYGAAFIIGVVASLSTCLVVVGAVVVSFAAKYQSYGTFYQRNVKPHLLFHLGRLLTFFVLGGVLGLVGSWFNISDFFVSWFTIFIALILLWLALNILGLVPSLSVLGIRMPKNSLALWKKLQTSEHALAPFVLGGFTFFLPCGFTQSMQLFAMASGDFMTGAITLTLFALGTTPVLFGLGVATTRFNNMKAVVLQKVIGFIVLLFAFYTLSSGLAIRGINIDLFSNQATTISSAVREDNVQVINMKVDYSAYTPSTFKLEKGVPVKWIIDGTEAVGCTNAIIVPDLGIKKTLTAGENIIEFTPQEVGTINFSCSMGMVRGKFIVE